MVLDRAQPSHGQMALDVTSKPSDPSVVSVELEPTLLRGIPLHSCLSGTGHHWRRPRTTQSFTTSSQQTKQFDIFFSHDWGSIRLSKHLSLLIVFNGLPAAGAGFAASLVMTLLETSHILPRSFWLPIFGHAVQLIVLFFWQYAWMCLRGPRMAFVDSSCIPQGDEVLKARCIQSLDQFLSKSKQLVALWSPQYFQRLWCSYELGFFLMKQKSAQTLHFVPVQIGLLCLLTFVGVTIFQAPLNIALYAFQLTWFQRVAVVCSSCVVQGAIVLPLQFFFWTNLLKELKELPQQLREFRVQDSQCTCCTLQHCHPVTKQPMPCDRELIYARIHSAFGRRLQESSALEAFNDYVRQTLASSVERNFRHHSTILRYTLLAAGPRLRRTCPCIYQKPSFSAHQETTGTCSSSTATSYTLTWPCSVLCPSSC